MELLPMEIVRVKSASPLILAMSFCAVAGCSRGAKADIREMTREFNDMSEIVPTITDRATFDAAKPKLQKLLASRYERQEKIKKMSAEERERRKKDWEALKAEPDGKKYEEAVRRYAEATARIMTMPEIGELYMKEVVEEVSAK